MKRANISHDDVNSSSSSSSSLSSLSSTVSPAHSPICFSTKALPQYQHHEQYNMMTLSPDHGLTPYSSTLQPASVSVTTASPTPASRTTSPELLVIPAEPRRRAGSRSKGNVKWRHTVFAPDCSLCDLEVKKVIKQVLWQLKFKAKCLPLLDSVAFWEIITYLIGFTKIVNDVLSNILFGALQT